MTNKYIPIRKSRDWKNLHPAPRVAVEEKNCCDCIFFTPLQVNGSCSIKECKAQDYDECSAFTRAKREVSDTQTKE